MKKRIVIVVVILLLLAGAGGAGWWWWVTYGQESEPAEGVLGGSGTIEAEEITIASLIGGRIVEVPAEEGSEVTSGTVLFSLDTELLQLQVDQAAAGVKAAQAALDQATADAAGAAEIARMQARLDQANAAQKIAEAQLSYATIASPMDGTVTHVLASVGENAAPGKTLATIADLSLLHVRIFIPETRIADVSLGDTAVVVTDSADREFRGRVVFIASEAEFTPSNVETKEQRVKLVYEVRLELDDPSEVLKPGMPVDVEFE